RRGVIVEGNFADLVLFDLDRLESRATYAQPQQMATGIERVWVNGVLAYVGQGSEAALPQNTEVASGQSVEVAWWQNSEEASGQSSVGRSGRFLYREPGNRL